MPAVFGSLALFSSLVALASFSLRGVIRHVPLPYMDEPFHLRQTQLFCNLEFSRWDPDITTFPGLYLLATALHRLSLIPCTLPALRAVSCALGIACGPASLLVPGGGASVMRGVAVALAPVAFFTSMLYYTDTGGVLFAVLCVAMAERGRPALSAAMGLLAVSFRQTNIVWAGFAAGVLLLQCADQGRGVLSILARPGRALAKVWPHLLLAGAFGAFLVWNEGSVVLGHHAHHAVTAHWAQLGYFFASFALLAWPWALAEAARTLASPRRALALIALAGIFSFLSHRYSVAHPFLLSDNRHYTFYAWRLLAKHRVLRLVAVPALASLGLVTAHAALSKRGAASSTGQFFFAGFLACLTIALVPTPLLEPRYFAVPTALLLAYLERSRNKDLAIVLTYSIINAAALFIFLFKPFTQPDGTTARFMY
jgi:alpha-1,2-glucosyltransferase